MTMNSSFPVGRAMVRLTGSTRLHLWLKAAQPGRTASLRLEVGERMLTLARTTGPGFAFHDVTPGLQGEGVLSWHTEDTLLSCLYAYESDTVVDQGIRLCYLDVSARAAVAEGIRFRAPMGWMNDPNGFCRAGGRYHLFYQHYPHALRWDNMHWGHATSTDLLQWVHLPVLLIPGQPTADEMPLGGAFSGSALGTEQGLRVFFTDHEATRHPKEFQRSSLVADGLHAEPATTILPDLPPGMVGKGDFRDPYVFRGPDGQMHMVLGTGDGAGGVVLLYSTDAPDGACGWIFRGELHRDAEDGTTVAECPCLVPVPGGREPLWALIYARMDATDPESGLVNPTRALVGRFDGARFDPLFKQTLDLACGSYARQAFHDPGEAGGETLAIGWLAAWGDWDRKSNFPTSMTLPRRLRLSPDGTALLTPPLAALASLRCASLATARLGLGEPLPLPPCAEVALRLSVPCHLAVSDGSLTIAPAADGIALRFGGRPPVYLPTPRSLRLFLDPGGIEVFGDDGRWTATHRLAGEDIPRSLTLSPALTGTRKSGRWNQSPARGQLHHDHVDPWRRDQNLW